MVDFSYLKCIDNFSEISNSLNDMHEFRMNAIFDVINIIASKLNLKAEALVEPI